MGVPPPWIIALFGTFITVMMWLAKQHSAANARKVDLGALMGE
jgi:MFS transporter, LPLT family, lysophospholipid transporter